MNVRAVRDRAIGAVLFAALTTPVAQLAAPAAAAADQPLPPRRVVDLVPRVKDLKPKDRKGLYVVDADVLFAFDRSNLGPDAKAVLADVVDGLRRKESGAVVVAGYTDDYGSDAYNRGLSRRRAATVVRYLRTHVGNPKLHYRAVGHGESDPVASNDTGDGRRQNRRVTVSR